MLGRVAGNFLKRGMGKRMLLACVPVSSDRSIMQKWMEEAAEPGKSPTDIDYSTVTVDGDSHGVITIKLNRPKQRNAFNMQMWEDLSDVFERLDQTNIARCVILRGEGTHFSSGMDLSVFPELAAVGIQNSCDGRRREQLMRVISRFQKAVSAPENCRVPVIAAIEGACIGGAVDLITACDIRLATTNSKFSVKEVDLGIVADIGTLQRLPFCVGEQRARELTFTGRLFNGEEARQYGLVLETCDELFDAAQDLATTIASKSPLTVRGAKCSLNFSREHSTQDGLNHVAMLNASILQSNDLDEAMIAALSKRNPFYPKP